MKDDENPKEEGYTAAAFIDPSIGDEPPVGGKIGDDAVCRTCMSASEEVSMRRGFVDPISSTEAQATPYACARCGKRIVST